MTKFIRMAAAVAAATAVTLSPLSIAHASSFGGSSSGGGTVVEQPTNPTTPAERSDEETAAEIRELFLQSLKKSGLYEKEDAQAKADEWAQKSVDGEIAYTADEIGVEEFQTVELGTDGLYAIGAVRFTRDMGNFLVNNPDFEDFKPDSTVVAPVGVTVTYADGHFHLVFAIKMA